MQVYKNPNYESGEILYWVYMNEKWFFKREIGTIKPYNFEYFPEVESLITTGWVGLNAKELEDWKVENL